MTMTTEEIIYRYRQAMTDHKKQIKIISELNGCRKEDIEKILAENGYMKLFVNGKDLSIDIPKMVDMRTHGKSQTEIAKLYGTTQPKISLLLNEKADEKKKQTERLEKIEIEQKGYADTVFRGTDPETRKLGGPIEWKKSTAPLPMQKEVVVPKLPKLSLPMDGEEMISQHGKGIEWNSTYSSQPITDKIGNAIAPAINIAIANANKDGKYATGGIVKTPLFAPSLNIGVDIDDESVLKQVEAIDIIKENAEDVMAFNQQFVSQYLKSKCGEEPIPKDYLICDDLTEKSSPEEKQQLNDFLTKWTLPFSKTNAANEKSYVSGNLAVGDGFTLNQDGEKFDPVEHPKGYCVNGMESIDIMLAIYGADAMKTFCKITAFQYLFRCDRKNGDEDVKKAAWYLNKFKELSK